MPPVGCDGFLLSPSLSSCSLPSSRYATIDLCLLFPLVLRLLLANKSPGKMTCRGR